MSQKVRFFKFEKIHSMMSLRFFNYYLCSVVIFFLASCNSPGVEGDNIRRFVFSIPHQSMVDSGIQFDNGNISSKKGLEEGIVQVEAYKKGENIFVIVDAAAETNLDKLISLVAQADQPGLLFYTLNNYAPLQRIYKLEQSEVYTAQEGQLINKPDEIKRFVLTLEIINDEALLAEYKHIHAPGMPWPQITANMKQIGIKEMEIYLQGYQAFLIMDTRPDFDLNKDGITWSKLPREAEWQEYVSKFQKVDPESKATEKWKSMKLLGDSKHYYFDSK